MSGMSYKLHERTSSAPPASGGSDTPSLAEMEAANVAADDAANVAAEAANVVASPEAVARERARGFQPTTVFENRRPAGLRLALAKPSLSKPHSDGKITR